MHLQLAKLCFAVYTTEYILFLFLFTERISKSRQGNLGGFQLLDLIITELKSHMTCYSSN